MLFQMIIHQFFAQYQNKMNSTKAKGRGLRKFNNSLISNTDFVKQMKQLIENVKQQELSESEQTDQMKWEKKKLVNLQSPIPKNLTKC